MAEDKHTYPSNHGPGTHWATDIAWQCLDALPIGMLTPSQRALISGMMTGAIMNPNMNAHEAARKCTDVLTIDALTIEQRTLITTMITDAVIKARTENKR